MAWKALLLYSFAQTDNFKAHVEALNVPLVPFSAKAVYWHIEKQFVINETVHYSHLFYAGAPHRCLLEVVATLRDQGPCPRAGV